MFALKDNELAFTSGPVARKFDVVEALCTYIAENWRNQPDLETMSRHIGFSPHYIQKAFMQWAGISPKEFIDALNIHEARKLLETGESLLEASHQLGLSGPGRLHDLFIKKERMSPGAYKSRGEGLSLAYHFTDTPFGRSLFIFHGSSLAGLSFCNSSGEQQALLDMKKRWPKARYTELAQENRAMVQAVFANHVKKPSVKIVLIGTDFDISVWEALTEIPAGAVVSYGQIASKLGRRGAVRAVAIAVGRNPISFVVPCHRVLRKDGSLGGYHWGLSRKCAILGWEQSRHVP